LHDDEDAHMNFELTEQQRRLAQEGQPIDVVDAQTNKAYVLIAKQRFEQVRSLLTLQAPLGIVPEGIRLSQEALRHDLPELLKQKSLVGQWVAYHRNERIGIARSAATLIRKCLERGLDDAEFYVGWINPCELIEEEEVEQRRQHSAE
jgi:hypothetical protein